MKKKIKVQEIHSLAASSIKNEISLNDLSMWLKCNRVESPFTETPSHTTVRAMSHTAVLLLCLPNS